MARSGKRSLVAALACAAAAGCVHVDPEPEWERVAAMVREQVHADPTWQSGPVPGPALPLDTLLADGLGRREAVEIALRNDPDLQIRFDQIGFAKAARVQAGLPDNPVFSPFPLFPISLADSTASLFVTLSDLWIVPYRSAMLDATLEAALRRAAAEAIRVAYGTSLAYDDVLQREQLLQIERQALAIVRERLDRSRGAGAHALESGSLEVKLGEQELAVAKAERDLRVARNRLRRQLALPEDAPELRLVDALEPPPDHAWTLDQATAVAEERRLDIVAARFDLEAARRRVALEKLRRIPVVSAGPGYDGAFGDYDAWGPGASFEIPVFDQNQAQIAAAEYRLSQARHRVASIEADARREVSDALAAREYARERTRVLGERVMPAHERMAGSTRSLARQSTTSFLQALELEEDALDSRRAFLRSLVRLRGAQLSLERSLVTGSDDDGGDDPLDIGDDSDDDD